MADTEQAAAGLESEPGELGPGRPRLSILRLILDQLAQLPPLPAAARVLPRRVRRDLAEHGTAYLYGVRAAVFVAGLGWLVAIALVLTLWAVAAPAGADAGVPLQVSGQLWLAAHHVLLHAPDGPFGLSPLGFTLLPLLGLVAAGRRTARRAPATALRASFGAGVGYALCACLIAASSASDGLSPDYTQVVLYPALIAVFGHAAGAVPAIRTLLPQAESRLAARGRTRAARRAVRLPGRGRAAGRRASSSCTRTGSTPSSGRSAAAGSGRPGCSWWTSRWCRTRRCGRSRCSPGRVSRSAPGRACRCSPWSAVRCPACRCWPRPR